jgi:hypothetical protein
MVDDRPEETGSLPDKERPKRPPPTIELEATEVSTEPQSTEPQAAASSAAPEPRPEPDPEPAAEPVPEAPAAPAPRPVSPWVIAPVSGAVAAALVIGVGWMLGWPTIQPAPAPPAPQLNAAAIDDLTSRIAAIETKVGRSSADAAPRMEGMEKSLTAMRGEIAATRVQGDKLAAAINEVKSAPRGDGSASPDLAAFGERIAKVESQMRAQGAEIAQQGSKIADTQAADAKPADDMPLRRVVAAALLDVLVRVGDPYPAALSAAQALAPNPDVLKPLDQFAQKGVPNTGKLSTELLALVPKLLPTAHDTATTGSGIVERLQAGAAKLVKIERTTDTAGTDRGAVVARVTAAAVRNDFNEARRELKTLEPADRAAAQAWLEKAVARDAALAASRQFAADAMAGLAKPAQ